MVLDPSAVAASFAENGLSTARPQRNSIIAKPTVTSPTKLTGSFSPSPSNKRQSLLLRPGFQTSTVTSRQQEGESIAGLMSPPSTIPPKSPEDIIPCSDITDSRTPRKSRPSLSDRTVETLSQIPPSPSPARRRQSGMFSPDTPMKPPSRAMSALGYSRPGSQMGSHATTRADRPPSPIKRGTTTHDRSQSTSVGARRIASSDTPGTKQNSMIGGPTPISRLQRPAGSIPKPPGASRVPQAGSKTLAVRPSKARSPVKDIFEDSVTKPPLRAPSRNGKTPASSGLRKPLANGRAGALSVQKPRVTTLKDTLEEEPMEDVNLPNSSQALRDAIKQAKATRKSISSQKGDPFMPRSVDDASIQSQVDTDPSSLDLLDSSHVNILRKRINNAKESGKLNIAALCLKELPIEVLKMYDAGSGGDGGPAWYECVDVTRLNAADNELTQLPEGIFPDSSSPRKMEFGAENEQAAPIFAGLEVMDVHGNQLKTLPLSIGWLTQLSCSNLSRNQLNFDCLETLSRISSLRELRLAENALAGALPDCIGSLENLEILDLHGNAITEISSSLGRLSKLKTLNVSSNQLSSLPMEAIFDLAIVEINASRNRLCDSLLPVNIPQVPFLRNLDVSTNALLTISDVKVDFLALESLNVSNNRIAVLPDLSGWQELTILNAEENKISEIPAGFTALKKLSSADFGNNSLLQLDEGIGSMDNLNSLNISNNPLRERRLLRLSADELKIDLRSRMASFSPSSDRSGSLSNLGSLSRSATWAFSGDTLDRSGARLKMIDKSDLEPLAGEEIRNLILHHNQLSTIPNSLKILGATLTSLDLSNNKLGKTDSTFLPHSLTLPHLQSLNLTSNALTTLTPLSTSLSAPKLATLILLFNRLTSLPTSPPLRDTFPNLSKLLASNNQISVLDVDAVRGLQVLDVSSNEIETLPPRLALLEGTLRTLMVTGNRFRVPSWGVLEKGTEEILKWCRRRIPRGEEGAMEEDEL